MRVSSLSPIFAMSLPSMRTFPDVAFVMAPRMCISDDFPQPDGPMIAVSSPSRTLKLIPRRASTQILPTLYVLRRSIVSSKVFIYKDLTYKFVSQISLVGERFNRILAGSLERRIKGPDDAAGDRRY